jgi:hypothetical protein
MYRSASGFVPSVSVVLMASLAGLAANEQVEEKDLCYGLHAHGMGNAVFYHPASIENRNEPGDVLQTFAVQMLQDSVDLPAAATEVINEHFWDLLL